MTVDLHLSPLRPRSTRGRDQKGQAAILKKLEKKTDTLQGVMDFVTKTYEHQLK